MTIIHHTQKREANPFARQLLPGDMIAVKLLVLCPSRDDPGFGAITGILDYVGVQYDTLATDEEELTEDRLSNGSYANYQGIIVTTGNPGQWDSERSRWAHEFSEQAWNVLHKFRARFGIRLATLFCQPGDQSADFDLRAAEFVDTHNESLHLSLTEAGQEIFWYLNPDHPIIVQSVAAYVAQSDDPANVPLLVTYDGRTAGMIRYDPQGCDQLTLTMGHSGTSQHTQLLGYGIINWVMRGLFLGQRHVYLNVQVDDIFNSNRLWDVEALSDVNGPIYRITADDVDAVSDWQERLRHTQTAGVPFMLDLAFNGAGVDQAPESDPLCKNLMWRQAEFRWINHGFTHLHLDDADDEASFHEIQHNHGAAIKLGLRQYAPDSMVTSDMSGLENSEFLVAAKESGVRYLVCDTSREGWANPSPNVGNQSEIEPEILVIPRHPTDLLHDASTPEEWVSRYNYIYRSYWGRDLSFEEIIEQEADVIVKYLLAFDIDPLMFHQANLRAYDGTHSLLSDLIDLVLAKYNDHYRDVPVVNIGMNEIGEEMERRAIYNSAKISANLIVGNGLILSADRDVTVAITGVHLEDVSECYANQHISLITLKQNEIYRIPPVNLVGYESALKTNGKS